MKVLSVIWREIWFTLTLLSGKLDERTIEGVNEDLFGFALLTLATLGSLAFLLILTVISVHFRIG